MYKFKDVDMKVPIFVWADKDEIEPEALEQARNVARLPFMHHHVAVMPDAHFGMGVSIGTVFAAEDVIIPNAVGVDIGCGMRVIKTGINVSNITTDQLKTIMTKIRKAIPVGFSSHKEPQLNTLVWRKSVNKDNLLHISMKEERLPVCYREFDKSLKSLGTLGGGNHFIEFQKNGEGELCIMIHSGSRNLGLQVANHYNNEAKKLNKKWHSRVPESYKLAFLPLDSDAGRLYLKEMEYCITYARINRAVMAQRITEIINKELDINIASYVNDIAHNYAVMENHYGKNVMVHRKGAVLAGDNIAIIPGSQGSCSYIVNGKSNKESFNSCPHGAGRALGRKKAIEVLDLNKEIESLNAKGILHSIRNIKDLDEAPSAYKDISKVMENSKDLVSIVEKLEPLAVIKA
jgi:tRNA-splicing ligase RtcB